MKRVLLLAFFPLVAIVFTQCKSGLVTMSNSCGKSISAGQAANKARNYNEGLTIFNDVLKTCDAYDAKEKGYAGKAQALNGLTQYNDALEAANQGLKINKTSVDNLFEKANAELGLNQKEEAKKDFSTIIDLTQKNKNVKERATIYAKMADIDLSQKMYADASNNLDAAISLDPKNPDFYMLRGDINSQQNQLNDAAANYDKAIDMGKDDAEAWHAKTATLIKVTQQKYGTDNISTLAKKMSSADKSSLCKAIEKAQSKGVKDVNVDLLQASICK
jgi:predicted Zn-dependent protease